MDPNLGKNKMANKLSRKEAKKLLELEDFNRITVTFYKYVHLNNLPEHHQILDGY